MTRVHLISLRSLIAAGCCLAAWPSTVLAAEEDKPTANLTVGAYSQYIWRGFELSKDGIVLQPSMTVGCRGLSLNLWGNLDTSPAGDAESSSWNETDLTLAYAWDMGPVSLGVGYIYYGLDGMKDSQEFTASAALNVLLKPTLTVYRDIAAYPGWYVTLGLSHSIPVGGDMTVDLGAQVGYLSADDAETYAAQDNSAYNAFHDGVLSVGMTIPLSKQLTLLPKLSYTFALTGDAEDLMRASSRSGDDDSFFTGGVALSFSF